MIRFTRSLCFRPNFAIFDFLKEKKTKKDDSDYDPANWKSLQDSLTRLRAENENKPKLLPIKQKKYSDKVTVVLEMDEVLIYSFEPDIKEMFMNAPMRDHDYYVELEEYDTFVHVYKRPHLDNFLDYLLRETEPVIWSKGKRYYVNKIMDIICPTFPQEHIFGQEDCNLIEEEDIEDFVKDFDRLGRKPERTVYIDSKPLAFWTFGDNCKYIYQQAIPINLFTADNTETKNDLLQLQTLLEELKSKEDVRLFLKNKFNVQSILREAKFIE